MRRDFSQHPARQGGFSLIAAVFLVTVLGALSVYLVTSSGRAQLQPQQAQLAAGAYQAAHAGLEWGIYQAIVNGNGNPNACNAGAFSPPGLGQFTVTVSCTSSPHRDDNTDILVFVVEASATTGTHGGLAYANRRMRAVVSPSAPLP
jgi:MSHA biogenesis protein MshP